jgi:hypothetical protein
MMKHLTADQRMKLVDSTVPLEDWLNQLFFVD